MNIFALGLGGAGGEIVGELLEEVKRAMKEGKKLNFDYVIIDFPKGIEKLSWEPEHEKRISLDKASEEWIKGNFNGFQKEDIPLDPETGTGRRRCYSKVTFEHNRTRIERALNDLLRKFFDEFRARDAACWIFTSFGGGTGSGMFIDLAVLLDKIRKEIELEGRSFSIYLVGILPSIANRGDDMLSPSNAIQAFKEIDYVVSGISEQEMKIRNPFDQIFIVGLYKMTGPLERAKLMIDKMVAKCIIEFCCGIEDFNDMVSVIRDKNAGLKDKRFLSFSIAHYRFPMDKILELNEADKKLLEKRDEEARLKEEIRKLDKEIKNIDNIIGRINEEITTLRSKVTDAKKGIVGPIDLIRISMWEKQIERLNKELKKVEDLKKPKERNKEVREEALKNVTREIEELSNKVAKLKVELEGEEKEYFSRESIKWTSYEKIKENIQDLRQRSLSDLMNYLKEKDIIERGFEEMVKERMEYLIKSQPLIISEKEEIPLLEVGYKAPKGSIKEGVLQQPAIVNEMETREILRKTDYEMNLYAILGGIKPEMINDLKKFIKDYYLEYQDSNPEVIDKSLAGFLWGKKWSEYNPEWLIEVKKLKSEETLLPAPTYRLVR